MAVFEETTYTPDLPRGGATFAALVASLAGTFAAWNDARQTRAALSTLSERQLEDIGLTRGDIDTI